MTLSALLSCVALGTAVFVSTNIDDILLLAVFFADDRLHSRAVVLGQFAGMAALVVAVAAVTLANGGDNLGVYVPLFAKQPSAIPAYAILFAVLTAAWCALGFFLVNNPLMGRDARRYGRLALPFVLVGLGLYILRGVRLS